MIKLLPLILMIFLLNACSQRLELTPKEYRYNSNISNIEYSNDSLYLSYSLQEMLKLNMEPFTPAKTYNKNLKTFVDTILYSPNKLNQILFGITQLGNTYIGYFFYCKRENLDSLINVFGDKSFSISCENYLDLKFFMREFAFGRKATDRDIFKEPSRNMDDIRFWESKEFIFSITPSKENKFFIFKK